ncbi:MAG: hypothetical protein ACYTFW_08640 [Planctomycetota bacterium]
MSKLHIGGREPLQKKQTTQSIQRQMLYWIEPGTESEEVELHFTKEGGANIFDVYETSQKNGLKVVSHGVKNNRYSFPAESVTTLVIKRSVAKGKWEHF